MKTPINFKWPIPGTLPEGEKGKTKTKKEESEGTASTPASEMNKKGPNDDKATKDFDPKTGKAVTKPEAKTPKGTGGDPGEVKKPEAKKPAPKKAASGDYASAKKKDPKLDSYIKARSNAKKGSSEYNAAQNKINKAYGKGPTNRPVTPKDNKVMQDQQNKAPKETKAETKTKAITDTGIPKDVKAPKPKTAMDKAKEAIASGDKKAARKSGLKGKTKRVAKKLAKGVDKAKKKATKEKQLAELQSAASPATFQSFDQMDSKNAMATAGEVPVAPPAPITYFKQAIKYDIKEASNPNLSASARKHYSRNAEADVKGGGTMAYKFGAMKGDQSASKVDYANYKGTDAGYRGKTGSSHGDQSATRADYTTKKGGSILSKHMKS